MQKIIECIPNFSEGRDKQKIESIVKAIKDIPGIIFLDQESDPAHNRSVISFAGEPETVLNAAFAGCKKASEIIDLNTHKGEHPRMGATDVIPFVPIKGVLMEDCVKLAERLGEKMGNELNIPVYLYEKAAKMPERQNLADVRKGEYEGIKDEIGKLPSRKPDFGPMHLGPAGATAVGAREALVAYNVNLKTDKLEIAKAIAKKIRESSGGLKFVKALGFALEDRGIVQISMNLTNYKVTPPHKVFREIKKECKKHEVEILESEVIGLIPQDALFEAAKDSLKISPDFKEEQILEVALQKKLEETENSPTLLAFLDSLASKSPTPGGGSVAALSGSLAAGLLSMVANLTLASKKYESAHEEIKSILKETESLRQELYELIEEDAKAYNKVMSAYKIKDQIQIQEALKIAAKTPLKTAETALKLLPLLKTLEEKGNQNASSDCGVAKHLIETAIKGALLNVRINLKYIEDTNLSKQLEEQCQAIEKSLSNYPRLP